MISLKKNTRISFKYIWFLCFFLVCFIMITFFLFAHRPDEKRFSHITSELFLEEMRSSTLNMHYTLAHPEAFGIPGYRPILPMYHAKSSLAGRVSTENTLATLYKINPDALSASDRYTHKLLTRSLENSLAMGQYPYYYEPLSPSSGMQSQLPILLAEYTFRQKRDVTDYLALLDQTDEYFESLLTYEQEKAAAGFPLPASSLKKVKEQCDTIVTKESLASGTHFLQTTFEERLLTLYNTGVITKQEFAGFLSQNDRLLKTVVLPAYQTLADGLFVLADESVSLRGLAANKEGSEYYKQLLIAETGSYRPLPEITSLLSDKLLEEYHALRDIVSKNPECTQHLSTKEYADFPYKDAATMLTDIQNRMKGNFPVLTSFGKGLPNLVVKTVSPNLENYCAPAFYLTSPIDDTDNNVIYINERNSPCGLELYTTLAHEGYPGHLYQNVYSNRYLLANKENKLRSILWYGGYLEGWALYVEFISFDYASALMQEHNRPLDATCIQLEKHNRSMQLCLYSLMDIMIHYDNASPEDLAKFLRPFGITDEASISAIYTYIAENPCNYLKYYLGYLEILELQKQAKDLWGYDYSDYAFHTFYLNCGPSDFTTLQEALQATSPVASPLS